MRITGHRAPTRLLAAVLLVAGCGGDGDGSSGPSSDDPNVDSIVNGFFNTTRLEKDGQGVVVRDSTFVVDTSTNRVERTTLDADGSVIGRGRLYYGEDGELVRDEGLDPDGELFRRTDYEHDADGRLVAVTVQGFGDSVLRTRETLTFDDDGRLIRRDVRDLVNDEPLSGDAFTLGDDGRFLSRERTLFERGAAVAVDVYTYRHDALGRIVGRDTDFDSDGAIDRVEELIRDADGNVELQTIAGPDGAIVSTDEYGWGAVDEPVWNLWLRIHRYFP